MRQNDDETGKKSSVQMGKQQQHQQQQQKYVFQNDNEYLNLTIIWNTVSCLLYLLLFYLSNNFFIIFVFILCSFCCSVIFHLRSKNLPKKKTKKLQNIFICSHRNVKCICLLFHRRNWRKTSSLCESLKKKKPKWRINGKNLCKTNISNKYIRISRDTLNIFFFIHQFRSEKMKEQKRKRKRENWMHKSKSRNA